MFPVGDGGGAFSPFHIEERQTLDDMGVGLKHLLHSNNNNNNNNNINDISNPFDYESNVVNGSGLNDPFGCVDNDVGFGSILSSGLNVNNSIVGSNSTPFIGFGFGFDFGVRNEKSQIYDGENVSNPSLLVGPTLDYSVLDQHGYPPQAKRHDPGFVMDNPVVETGQDLFFRLMQNHNHLCYPYQDEVVKDHIFKACEMLLSGNFSLAEEILARLNQNHFSVPTKPLVRVAFYIKEALQMILLMSSTTPVGVGVVSPPKALTPYDVVLKMNAYEVLSEISPITQFANFTSVQAILEAVDDDASVVHVVDFDIGCGAQWASFIQELPLRKKGAPSLRITAFVSLSTSHPFELALVRDNLAQFASDVGVVFEFHVVNFDLFDTSSSSSSSSIPNITCLEDESTAVCFPIWATSNKPSVLPSVLRFINQLSPKIVVAFDRGFDRFDVPFPQHLIHTLESCTSFLESLDGLNVEPNIISKVDKFFVQPKIENIVVGRINALDKLPHWKSLFTSAGFTPFHFSNFTEIQADYTVKRTPGRGFRVEKHQASLVLSWQHRELIAVSAWRF